MGRSGSDRRGQDGLRPFWLPWAKLTSDGQGKVTGFRSLRDHCLDVASVTRVLLEEPILRSRLARLAGVEGLNSDQRQRLAVLAGLHDLGKANLGFQNKGLGRSPQAGHLGEVLAVLKEAEPEKAQELIRAAELSTLLGWIDGGERALCEFLYVLFSHHGRLVSIPDEFPRRLWCPSDGYDPINAVSDCAQALQAAFPSSTDTPPLPSQPPFLHAFLGLLTLADWLGSDERFFPLMSIEQGTSELGKTQRDASVRSALQRTGLESGSGTLGGSEDQGLDAEGFTRIFGFAPNPVQAHALSRSLPGPDGSLLALEAETGSGKTEMALAWFLRLYRAGKVSGLFFALPTRAAAVQIHARVQRFLESAGDIAAEPILAVPGYTPPAGPVSAGILSDGRRYEDRGTESESSWASEHPKRFMAGRVVVGTVDQVLLSGLQVRHAHMRASALLRHLLVVDEVHASDPYMESILEAVLHRHRAAGGHALLLSATLGEAARCRFLNPRTQAQGESFEAAVSRPYPALWCDQPQVEATSLPVQGQGKEVSITTAEAMTDPASVARMAVAAAEQGARVGILRNTVKGAVATQQALEAIAPEEALFTCGGVAAPHHSRYAREDRIQLDRALEVRLQREGPLIVAATQTIEQSLDIDFDLLIADLCPIDVLLQRLGRLHRHRRSRPADYESPQAVVLTPEPGLGSFLGSNGEARGPLGLGLVYPDLVVLERTREVLEERSTVRIPADSRELIERVLHPDRLRELADVRGDTWFQHWSYMWGVRMSQKGTAELGILDWSLPPTRSRFAEPGEEVRTRLGTDSRRLVLPTGASGVFGTSISEVTVPGWMAQGLASEPAVGVEKDAMGSLIIKADQRLYRYDRLGLRPEEGGGPS